MDQTQFVVAGERRSSLSHGDVGISFESSRGKSDHPMKSPATGKLFRPRTRGSGNAFCWGAEFRRNREKNLAATGRGQSGDWHGSAEVRRRYSGGRWKGIVLEKLFGGRASRTTGAREGLDAVQCEAASSDSSTSRPGRPTARLARPAMLGAIAPGARRGAVRMPSRVWFSSGPLVGRLGHCLMGAGTPESVRGKWQPHRGRRDGQFVVRRGPGSTPRARLRGIPGGSARACAVG